MWAGCTGSASTREGSPPSVAAFSDARPATQSSGGGGGGGGSAAGKGGGGEEAEFVEEVGAVAAGDEFDEAVLGGGRDWACADDFCAGRAVAVNAVAAKDVALISVAEGAAGAAGFLLDDDLDRRAVGGGGGGDE